MKIKPCPFCGNKALLIQSNMINFVQCGNCSARGPSKIKYKTAETYQVTGEQEAIEAWNERK